MPPRQCPECGRFLRKDLVEALASGPQPCPRCEAPLTAEMFREAGAPPSEPAAVAQSPESALSAPPTGEPVAVPEPAEAPPAAAASPAPAQPPVMDAPVEGTSDDPLQGWDADGYVARTTDVLQAEDRTPVLAAGGAASGALIGFVALGRTRSRGALLGALVGAATGAVVARMTRPVE